jgi:hypothetical protein
MANVVHVELTRCPRCGWSPHELTHSLYECDDCAHQFYAEEPCPQGTNQDVMCPKCHSIETGPVLGNCELLVNGETVKRS